jgi:hypothetical protein
MTIERGFFELYRMEPLEIVVPPKDAISKEVRCVSSYVKVLRLNSGISEDRGAADMIAAQNANSKHWDNDWIHQYPQRYANRKVFVKLITQELKKRAKLRAGKAKADQAELDAILQREEAEESALAASEADIPNIPEVAVLTRKQLKEAAEKEAENNLIAKLERSKRNYVKRKRDIFQAEVCEYCQVIFMLPDNHIYFFSGRPSKRNGWSQDHDPARCNVATIDNCGLSNRLGAGRLSSKACT